MRVEHHPCLYRSIFTHHCSPSLIITQCKPVTVVPGQVSELGVYRTGDHFCVDGLKLVDTIAERDDLSGADKRAATEEQHEPVSQINLKIIKIKKCPRIGHHSQVQRVEEEDQIFPLVVRQLHLLELSVDDGRSFPVWSWL